MHIYIPSKGRAEDCRTAALLTDGCLVVEPQDECDYRERYNHNMIVLPENDRGISYARNRILKDARDKGHKWIWMLDDDSRNAFMVSHGRNHQADLFTVLQEAQEVLVNVVNLAVGALEYQQYAWSAKKPLAMNSYCDVAVLVNIDRTRTLQYRDNCKEDRDFVLQCLAAGRASARSTRHSFAVPKNGSNKGGLHADYSVGREVEWSRRMVELWPGICEPHTKKDGRPDVKIHWRKIAANN